MAALIEYSKEIVPMFISLGTKRGIIKEMMDEDQYVQECLQEIAAMQENIKDHVVDKEPELVREIKALETDIALACKGAARGTSYKAAELKGFFSARAKLSVEKVVGKGELFSELDKELA